MRPSNYHFQYGMFAMSHLISIYLFNDLQHRYFIFVCRFPFNAKNPFGFLIALALQYIMFSYAAKIAAGVLALAIGLYLYTIAMSKCVKQNLIAMSQSFRSKSQSKTARPFIRDQFIEYIKCYSSVRR